MADTDSDESLDELLENVVLYDSRLRARRREAAKKAAEAAAAAAKPRQRKKRKKEEHKREPVQAQYAPGDIRRMRWDPAQSPWWRLINRRGVRETGTRAYNKFRAKFRLPLTVVEDLVERAQAVDEWKDKPAGPGHGRGPARFPLMIKVLAALRCLAKGVDVDGVEEAAHISTSSLKVFVPAFIRWLAKEIFPEAVRLPEGEHLQGSLRVFARLGFPGAYCLADGVHLFWDRCPAKLKALYSGKEGYPTLAFNVSVLQSREIIHVADWLPGSKNDKTQAAHDELFRKARVGELHPDEVYVLYTADGGTVVCKGLYIIVDAGYHQWRCLQGPLKVASGDDATAWNERLESVRKAVECVFGILKKRFRILRNDFECSDPEDIAATFKACCALHNILLRHDKRDKHGHGNTGADWLPATRAKERLDTEAERSKHVVRGPRNVGHGGQREPGHAVLRERLIAHFGQAMRRREAAWLAPAHPSVGWAEAEVRCSCPCPHAHMR